MRGEDGGGEVNDMQRERVGDVMLTSVKVKAEVLTSGGFLAFPTPWEGLACEGLPCKVLPCGGLACRVANGDGGTSQGQAGATEQTFFPLPLPLPMPGQFPGASLKLNTLFLPRFTFRSLVTSRRKVRDVLGPFSGCQQGEGGELEEEERETVCVGGECRVCVWWEEGVECVCGRRV